MAYRLLGFKYFVLFLIIATCSTFCRAADPMFVTSSWRQDKNTGEYYMCPDMDKDYIRLLPQWPSADSEDLYNAKVYASPANSTVVDMTTPIEGGVIEGKKITHIKPMVTKDFMEYKTLKQNVTKVFTFVMTNLTTNETQTASITVKAYYVSPPTGIEDLSFCEKNQQQIAALQPYFNKYNWYESDGTAISGLLGITKFMILPVGEHDFIVKNKGSDGHCNGDPYTYTVTVKGKDEPELNHNTIVYSSDEDFNNNVQQQSLKTNDGYLIDDDEDCALIWYDTDGNKLTAPYTPPMANPGEVNIYTPSVSQDCGCGESEKKQYMVITMPVPSPKVKDLELCAEETDYTVTVKHQVSINTTSATTKDDYLLELSTEEDFSASTKGAYGEETVNIIINAKGEKEAKYFVRQVNKDGITGIPKEFYVRTKKVEEPKLAVSSDKFCLSEAETIDLDGYLETLGNVEWREGTDIIPNGTYDFTSAGVKTFSVRYYAKVGGEKCYSSSVDLTLEAISIETDFTVPTEVCSDADLELSVSATSSKTPTYKWTCVQGGKIDTGADAGSSVVVHPQGSDDYTVKCSIEVEICTMNKTFNVPKIKGKTEGTVKIVRSDGTANTYDADGEILMESCDLDSKVIVSLSHTNSEIAYMGTMDAMPIPLSYSGDEATFDLKKWGTYWIRFNNICAQEITFDLKKKNAPTQELTSNSERLCKGDKTEIDLSAFNSSAEWRDESDNVLAESKGKLSDETTLNYKFLAYPYSIIKGDGNTETRCYGTPASLIVTLDTLSVEIDGEKSLCLGEKGELEAKVKSTDNANASYLWVLTPSGELNYTDKLELEGTGKKTKAELTVTTSTCKKSASYIVEATQGTANGTITFTKNSDNSAETYNTDSEISIESCDLDITVTFDLDHTSSDITITTPSGNEENLTFTGNKSEYIPSEWGKYKMSYTNGCSVEFEFTLKRPNLSTITLTKDKDYLCKSSTTSIDLSSYTQGSGNVEWRDENDNALSSSIVNFSDETKRIYSYTAYPYSIITNKDGIESRCYGEAKTLDLYYDALTTEIVGAHSICPDEEIEIKANTETTSDETTYQWSVSPSSALSSSSLSNDKIMIKGGNGTINISLEVKANACTSSLTHTVTVGKGTAKGTVSMVKDGKEIKKVAAGEETLEFVYCGGQQLKLNIDHTKDEYSLISSNGDASTKKFSDGDLSINGEGNYTILFTNQCETELKFSAKSPMKPKINIPASPLCLNTETYIYVENAQGCTAALEGEKEYADGRISFTPKQTGTIEKTYTVNCDGCEITPTDKLITEVNSDNGLGEEIIATVSEKAICNGETIEVTELYTIPESDFTARWENNSDIKGNKNSLQVTIKPDIRIWKNGETERTLSYTITLTSTSNCATSANKEREKTVSVKVGRPIEFTIEGPSTVCSDEAVTLSIKGVSGSAKYSWSSEDDSSVEEQTKPSITVRPEIGTNKYAATVYRNGCEATQIYSIKGGATPVITAVHEASTGAVTVAAESPSGKALNYNIGKESFENGDLGRLIPGKYSLKITDTDGCRLDTVITISEPKKQVEIFFTPNGDGENDVVSIPGEFLQYESTKMYIYDRSGKKIAVLDSNNSEWDGTYNGHEMPSADYWYVLYVDAIRKYYTGHFTLIRN